MRFFIYWSDRVALLLVETCFSLSFCLLMLPLYYNVTLMPMVMVCYAEDVPTEHAQHFIIILMGLCGV